MADILLQRRGAAALSRNVSLRHPVQIIEGRDAIVGMKHILVELSALCGQSEVMDDLEYFLDRPAFKSKKPWLVLLSRYEESLPPKSAADIVGAVLVYEYQLLGFGSKVFVADYHGGDRTVIAPQAIRRQAAFEACAALLRRGALLVHVSVAEDLDETKNVEADWGTVAEPGLWWRWIAKARRMPGYLKLSGSLDGTLATLGKHTRRNLRLYRRRAEADLDYEFVGAAKLTKAEFLELNRMCPYPAEEKLAAWRWDVLQDLRNGVLLGLRKRSGEWLSLVGGRLHEDSISIEWQMNRPDLPSNSLCTVMRSHLIEHTVDAGMKRLYFVGGTSHSLRYSLVDQQTVDLVGLQFQLPKKLVGWLAQPLMGERNFVVQHLLDGKLDWQRW